MQKAPASTTRLSSLPRLRNFRSRRLTALPNPHQPPEKESQHHEGRNPLTQYRCRSPDPRRDSTNKQTTQRHHTENSHEQDTDRAAPHLGIGFALHYDIGDGVLRDRPKTRASTKEHRKREVLDQRKTDQRSAQDAQARQQDLAEMRTRFPRGEVDGAQHTPNTDKAVDIPEGGGITLEDDLGEYGKNSIVRQNEQTRDREHQDDRP